MNGTLRAVRVPLPPASHATLRALNSCTYCTRAAHGTHSCALTWGAHSCAPVHDDRTAQPSRTLHCLHKIITS